VERDSVRDVGEVVQSVGLVLLVLLVWTFLLEVASERSPELAAVGLVLVLGGGLLKLSAGVKG
jgi:hypothetical protein